MDRARSEDALNTIIKLCTYRFIDDKPILSIKFDFIVLNNLISHVARHFDVIIEEKIDSRILTLPGNIVIRIEKVLAGY